MTINIIDPHIHLFDRSRGDYHWLNSENPPFWSDKSIIQRDFNIEELNNSLQASNKIKLAGFVHIEAGFDNTKPWRELAYIESISSQNKRTVASINLLEPPETFKLSLQRLLSYRSLIGARHILDEQAHTILANQNAQQNFATLNKIPNFVFELQLPLADANAVMVLPLLKQIIATNSHLRFIINHAGFPPKTAPETTPETIKADTWEVWKKHIHALAQYPNVFIKCSGWEMEDRQYEMSWLSEVTSFCIQALSIERVMLASNFPLCLFAQKSYEEYWQDVLQSSVMMQCSENEKNALLYSNALGIYQLSNPES